MYPSNQRRAGADAGGGGGPDCEASCGISLAMTNAEISMATPVVSNTASASYSGPPSFSGRGPFAAGRAGRRIRGGEGWYRYGGGADLHASYSPTLPPVEGGSDVDPDGSSTFTQEEELDGGAPVIVVGGEGGGYGAGDDLERTMSREGLCQGDSGRKSVRRESSASHRSGSGPRRWGYEHPPIEAGVGSLGVGYEGRRERLLAAERDSLVKAISKIPSRESDEGGRMFEECIESLSLKEERRHKNGRANTSSSSGSFSMSSSSSNSGKLDLMVPVSVWDGRRKYLLLACSLCVIIAGLAAGLGVMVLRSNIGGDNNVSGATVADQAQNTTAPTEAPVEGSSASSPPAVAGDPTVQPTLSPVTDEQTLTLAKLRNFLSYISPDGGEALSKPGTPQHSALNWLHRDPSLNDYEDYRLAQRYALGTFCYGTDSVLEKELDDDEGRWMKYGTDECRWYGVVCEGEDGDGDDGSLDDVFDANVPSNMAGSGAHAGNVTELALGEANLTGAIVPELAILSALTDLDLYENELRGSLPSTLGTMSALEKIHVDGNRVGGTLPKELFALPKLRELRLEDNEMTGTVPTEIGRLGNGGGGAEGLGRMSTLRLDENLFTGTVPTELGLLSNLDELRMDANRLEGSIPPEVMTLPRLRELRLDDNGMSGRIPIQPRDLPSLEVLRLDYNDFSGSIPSAIGMLTYLRQLALNHNRIGGTLPTEMGKLFELEYLRLYKNRLTGTIPTQLGLLTGLVHLRLDGEPIDDYDGGNIPGANLRSVPDSENELRGTIPTELGNLNQLEVLYLHGNKLDGTIPDSFGDLTEIVAMYLYNNLLTGTVPSSLGNLGLLEELYIDGNDITGTMPREVCALREEDDDDDEEEDSGGNLSKLTSDCKGAPPKLFCPCCSKCYPLDAETWSPTSSPHPTSAPKQNTTLPPTSTPSKQPTTAPTAAPSTPSPSRGGKIPIPVLTNPPAPTNTPTPLSADYAKLLALLSSSSPDGGKALLIPKSNQRSAASWLVENPLYSTYSEERKIVRYALAMLYLSLDGPGWTSNDGWMDDRTDECDWAEVVCDEQGKVSKLNLYDNELAGTMPGEIVMLRDGLRELVLYSNRIRSPPSKMETGTTAGDEDDDGEGRDWSFLGALTELRVLDLDENALGGTIPTELGKLVNIEKLYLGSNGIAGTLPTGVFARKANLKLLRLENNRIRGTIPAEVVHWSPGTLETLRLSDNDLEGRIPPWIGALRSLKDLRLDGNDLSGYLPKELGALAGLETLRLDRNNFTTNLPSELFDLMSLNDLRLADPESDIEANIITGTLPTEIGQLLNLTELLLQHQRITGTIPSEMGGMIGLTELRLDDNLLVGTLPSTLGDLSNLEIIRLDKNLLNGTLPSELGQLTSLQVLRLDGPEKDDVPGDGPDGNEGNSFSSTIPTEFGRMVGAVELRLTENELTGEIPSELGMLTNLADLRLGVNKLTGSIPSELALLTELVDLDLYYNFLTGWIPRQLGRLTKLEDLYLDANYLSGPIPVDFGNMDNLNELFVGSNDLTGSMPAAVCHLRAKNLEELVSDCGGDVPEVTCPMPGCCTECED